MDGTGGGMCVATLVSPPESLPSLSVAHGGPGKRLSGGAERACEMAEVTRQWNARYSVPRAESRNGEVATCRTPTDIKLTGLGRP